MTQAAKDGAPTRRGRRFLSLLERSDGLYDVFLDGRAFPAEAEGGTDYDIMIYVVRGIDAGDFKPDLESHIREHWDEWKEAAEVVWL